MEALLHSRIAQLEETLATERDEFKAFYRAHKDYTVQYNGSNEYVNEDYFKESQYIHTLKKQIESLTQQNTLLRSKNQKLMQELDELKHPEA